MCVCVCVSAKTLNPINGSIREFLKYRQNQHQTISYSEKHRFQSVHLVPFLRDFFSHNVQKLSFFQDMAPFFTLSLIELSNWHNLNKLYVRMVQNNLNYPTGLKTYI